MTDAPEPTIASQVDAHGYVSVYDHGPVPPPADATEPQKQAAAAERKEWDKLHGKEPVALQMAAGDATHAMAAEPDRYFLMPHGIDEGAVKAKMDEIRKKREAAAKANEDVADRKQAIAEVIAEHAAKAKAPAKPGKGQDPHMGKGSTS